MPWFKHVGLMRPLPKFGTLPIFSLQKLEVFEFTLGTIQQHVHDNGRIRIGIQEEIILNKSWLIRENYKAD